MKTWMIFLTLLVLGSTHQASAKNPTLKVVVNTLMSEITLTCHLPDGNKTAIMGTAPVQLKEGLRYSLSISKEGYNSYHKSFIADWEGQKVRSVVLEDGIEPSTKTPWLVDLEDSVKMEFMPIPVGEFKMGSDEGSDDEQPVHLVSFSRPFWMAKTEVTNQQYQQFKTNSHTPEENEVVMPSGAGYPVCWVSWNDAAAFCDWLTKKERRKGRLPEGYEYTLPTEAEWEYACRAGSTGDFAGEMDSMGWYNKNSAGKTNPVGNKKPNAWGLHDMHGNVWEWCADYWYGTYDNAPVNGSQRGLAYDEYEVDRSLMNGDGHTYRLRNTAYRVVRGGSWHYSASACRSANRYYHKPSFSLNYLGFRPVLLWNPPQLKMLVTEHLKEKE